MASTLRIGCVAALSLGVVACTNDYDGLVAGAGPGSSAGGGGALGTGAAAPGSGGAGAVGEGSGGAGAIGGGGGAVTSAGGAGGAAVPCAPGDTYKLSDDFEDGAYAAGWEEYQSGSVDSEETGGRLHVEVAQTFNFGNWGGVRGGASNLRGCSILVRAVEVPSAEALAYLGFNTPDGYDGVAIAANDGAFNLCQTVSGIPDCQTQNHDPAHVWWRIREDQDQVFFETSPDGAVWALRRQVLAPAWVEAGEPEIGAGTQGDVYATREAEFDDFNRPP